MGEHPGDWPSGSEYFELERLLDKYSLSLDYGHPDTWRVYYVISKLESRASDKSLLLIGAFLMWLVFALREKECPFSWLYEFFALVLDPTMAWNLTGLFGVSLIGYLLFLAIVKSSPRISVMPDEAASRIARNALNNRPRE